MEHLRAENYQAALSLLTKAADLLNDADLPVKLQAITLNNLGCFYKRTGKLGVALQYLHRALDLEVASSADRTNLAGTHLNVCAIHSSLGRHDNALRHAYEALDLMKDADETANNAATLAIAFHNAGVEEEHLKNFDRAAEMYAAGWKAASRQLGPSHTLTLSLKESYQATTEVKSKVNTGKSGRELKLPTIPRVRRGTRHSFDGTYQPRNSKSVVNTRDSTPARLKSPIDPIRSAPGASTKQRRGVPSGRPLRSFRFKKQDSQVTETKLQSKRIPSLSLWKKLHDAAVTIQRHWRGFRVRQSLKAPSYLPSQSSRRREAERMAKEALAELELLKQEVMSGIHLSLPIQSARKPPTFGKLSGFRRPNSLHFQRPLSPIPESSGEVRKERLRQLQSLMRGVLARRELRQRERAAVVIQKQARSRPVRVLFNKVLAAICLIQESWRRLRVESPNRP
jgi:hypothetical protein